MHCIRESVGFLSFSWPVSQVIENGDCVNNWETYVKLLSYVHYTAVVQFSIIIISNVGWYGTGQNVFFFNFIQGVPGGMCQT